MARTDDRVHFGEAFPALVADLEEEGNLDRRTTSGRVRWIYSSDGSPQHEMGADESHSLGGSIDRPALIAIRDAFNTEEPLAAARLDDFLDPNTLEVQFDGGLYGAENARLGIQWTTRDGYKFHYTDSQGVNLRWGKHPHDGDYVHANGPEHYHPPPDASSDPNTVENSCVTQSPALLVTRAVCKLRRVAYHADSLSPLNAGSNPP